MQTAIAIVAYRNAEDVRTCLAALARQRARDFSVHICENGGLEAFARLVDGLSGMVTAAADGDDLGGAVADEPVWRGQMVGGGQPIHVICSRANRGYAGGINRCIRDAMPDRRWAALWVLNPDTEPHPDALLELLRRAASGSCGIVGGRLVFKGTGRVQLYAGRWRRLMARGYNIGLNAPVDAVPDVEQIEREMNYVSGASMLVSRAFLQSVGPMDERYFLYNEEVDWCFRRGGYRLGYAHEAVVHHAHGSTMGSSSNRRRRSALSVYLDERNKLLFTSRFFPRLYPLVVLVTLFLTAQYLRHGAVRNFAVAIRGWFAGLRGEDGPPVRYVTDTIRGAGRQPDPAGSGWWTEAGPGGGFCSGAGQTQADGPVEAVAANADQDHDGLEPVAKPRQTR